MDKPEQRFDALLKAMTGPNAQRPSSTRPASNAETDDDCDETQTHQGISPDADDRRECEWL